MIESTRTAGARPRRIWFDAVARDQERRRDDDEDRRQSAEQRPAPRAARHRDRWPRSWSAQGSSRSGSATTSCFPATIESRYPFADDGRATWATDTPYFDALIALALIAAGDRAATIGTAVLVLPLRQPVVFAKQAASIDVASGGRLRLGVGAGWLEEEFDALNVPFDGPGPPARGMDRARPRLLDGRARRRRSPSSTTLPAGVLCLPSPGAPRSRS